MLGTNDLATLQSGACNALVSLCETVRRLYTPRPDALSKVKEVLTFRNVEMAAAYLSASENRDLTNSAQLTLLQQALSCGVFELYGGG